MVQRHVPLRGSRRTSPVGAERAGQAEPNRRIPVTVVLEPAGLPDDHEIRRKVRRIEGSTPGCGEYLTGSELEELCSPSERHVQTVRNFAAEHDLDVVEVSRAQHHVVLEGRLASFNDAFRVVMEDFEHPDGTRSRAHDGPIHVPSNMEPFVESVLGLDDVPLGRHSHASVQPAAKIAYTPRDVAEVYRFPAGATGEGQRVAIITFAGGFHRTDIEAYFDRLLPVGIAPPTVTAYPDEAANAPPQQDRLAEFIRDWSDSARSMKDMARKWGTAFPSAAATLEATMDIEIAGSVAPGAAIDVHFQPRPSALGFYRGINSALGLDENVRSERPTVLSLSWGAVEAGWQSHAMEAVHHALEKSKWLGVTACVSSGDLGSRGTTPGDPLGDRANVSYPASDPYVLACGGTTMGVTAATGMTEVVWSSHLKGESAASGGGISGCWDRPRHQAGVGVPTFACLNGRSWCSPDVADPQEFVARGVPDVAASADPQRGYQIFVGGMTTTGGGTSASAPLWAALVAQLAERLGGPLGFLTPRLYHDDLAATFRQIRAGNNYLANGHVAYFESGPGWNGCTGLGTPNGVALLAALEAAGDGVG